MSDEFDFSEDDEVLVRVRERGDSGNIEHKFSGTVGNIRDGRGPLLPMARIRLPFGTANSVTLKPHEAEFEVIDNDE